ncbi:MAG: HD domain-containing protein [Proteobacteria bacterium]|nr:HD domain-containing protein [Pseudomonadota bacterium]
MEKILQWAWFRNFPQQKAVCGQILKLLDQEGLCPSVVDIHGDVEGSWDDNTYRLLAQTTLLDHSLNVAEQVVQILSDNKAWHVIPDTMVAALAHDLGKLTSMRGYLYSLGEHPLAAGRPLAGIPGFNELPKKNEILRAIKLHHKMPQGLLGKTLKKADQLARQKELEETVLQNETKSATAKKLTPNVETKRATQYVVTAAWRAQTDIYGDKGEINQGKSKSEAPKLMDISSWFDGVQFLEELKPYINKMFGRRFLAFSMPDGHVYFQVKVLEEVARKQAEQGGCMEIATMAPRDETMRRVLLTIVHHLRVEHEVIDQGLIKDTFFGGYFTVTRKTGKTIKGYYTPFHAEAFAGKGHPAGSIAEMEQAKPKILRDILKVSPYLDNTQDT